MYPEIVMSIITISGGLWYNSLSKQPIGKRVHLQRMHRHQNPVHSAVETCCCI